MKPAPVTVDGDTSTNDSYIIAATGKAGNDAVTALDSADGMALVAVLEKVSLALAQAIVRDGEGATKFMTIAACAAAKRSPNVTASRAPWLIRHSSKRRSSPAIPTSGAFWLRLATARPQILIRRW